MTRPVNVAVLGATGSIGQQTLDVIDRNPARLRLFGLTEGRRSAKRTAEYLIQGQAGEADFDARVEAMVTDPRCDLVVVAIPGARALAPTLAALKAGKEVALATKEVLVMAGALVMRAAGERGIRPVDSEHSAIWQCLWGERRDSVRRLILTASGGPFWAHPDLDLDQVTVEQALNHPRWSMGPKVTVDSATLMNKGLEVIEAHHLFGVPLDQISVFIHPQSVVHSMVEFVDGSLKGAARAPGHAPADRRGARLPGPPRGRGPSNVARGARAGWSSTPWTRTGSQASGWRARPRWRAAATPRS